MDKIEASQYDHIAHLRRVAKRCLTCEVPMIGTNTRSRQKYCSPECLKESHKKAKKESKGG